MEQYVKEYKRFLAQWECVHKMNRAGIYDYGLAKRNCSGGAIVEFESHEQKKRYMDVFGEGAVA